MYIFATAGGVGPAMDSIFCCSTIVFAIASLIVSFVSLIRRSNTLIILASVLMAASGFVIIIEYYTVRLSGHIDEPGDVEVRYNMARIWLIATVTLSMLIIVSYSRRPSRQ